MLKERAVLMRLSISLPGEHRQDPGLTSEVKSEHGLGSEAGQWSKKLYPKTALEAIKKLDNEARSYHATVTLPYDVGIGILPASLIFEYGNKMREFQGRREVLRDEFLKDPERWIKWAVEQHNGTFDPNQYPGCREAEPVVAAATGQNYQFDPGKFQAEMARKFAFEAEPLPVPASDHFSDTVSSLLGVDRESVDRRVREAEVEAQKELMRRLIAPVSAMAAKLAEAPKVKKDGTPAEDIVFRDTLVGNIQEIARLAPALNLGCDAAIDGFIAEMETLTRYTPQVLRDDKATRAEAQKAADALAKKMTDYQF